MNVLVVMTDQHNADFMGCTGAITRTPVLDALSSRGTRFTCAYSNSPFCAPARAAMLTGRFAHEIGNWDNATPYNGRLPSWPRYFRENGVDFTVTGKVDFEDIPEMDYGIGDVDNIVFRQTFDVLGIYPEGKVTPRYRHLESHWTAYPREPESPSPKDEDRLGRALNWLREKRPKDRPWILDVNFSKPHPRWTPSRELYEHYLPKIRLQPKHLQPFSDLHPCEQQHSNHTCGYLRPNEDIVPMHAAYHATVEEVDAEIGTVIRELENQGIREDTLIIYTTDHGEMLRAHGALGKMSLYDDSARIPMIVQGPGVPEGATCDEPVSLIDLYPTVAEALGVRPAPFARGDSLISIAKGEVQNRPDFAFSESHANGRVTGSFMIRTKEWKLIENVGYEPMLFNLREDPGEMNDLAREMKGSDVLGNVLYELQRRLYSVCLPEAVTVRAGAEQRARREYLESTGRLYEELKKRFCLPDPESLLLDPVAVEKQYGIKIDGERSDTT